MTALQPDHKSDWHSIDTNQTDPILEFNFLIQWSGLRCLQLQEGKEYHSITFIFLCSSNKLSYDLY